MLVGAEPRRVMLNPPGCTLSWDSSSAGTPRRCFRPETNRMTPAEIPQKALSQFASTPSPKRGTRLSPPAAAPAPARSGAASGRLCRPAKARSRPNYSKSQAALELGRKNNP